MEKIHIMIQLYEDREEKGLRKSTKNVDSGYF